MSQFCGRGCLSELHVIECKDIIINVVSTRQHEVAKLLIEYGADVNLRATNGCGAFEVATFNGDIEMVQLIASIAMGKKSKTGVFLFMCN